MIYKCNQCNKEFDEPYVHIYSSGFQDVRCPYCGSTTFKEIK